MVFLFGESVRRSETAIGSRPCPICQVDRPFVRVVKTNFFTIFGLRLLPLGQVAEYLQCTACGQAFDEGSDCPSHHALLLDVIAYLMLGYGVSRDRALAGEVYEAVTRTQLADTDLAAAISALDAGQRDLFDSLRQGAAKVNTRGKQEIVQAGYLVAYASCELEHDDRVRLNLIGNALDVPISFVAACIEDVRARHYLGIRRRVPTLAS